MFSLVQGLAYIEYQRQSCDDAAMTLALLAWSWSGPIDSIVFNENRITIVIAESSQDWRWRLV